MEISRKSVYWGIAARPAWRWLVTTPFAALGIYQTVREQLSPEWKDNLRLPSLLDWPWEVFFMLALISTVFIVLESAFKAIKQNTEEEKKKRCELEEEIGHLKDELNRRRQRRETREQLGQFLLEGRELRSMCANETKEPPTKEADDWVRRMHDYALANALLGKPYAARLHSDAGLPLVGNSISSVPHRRLWHGVDYRMARLGEFMKELGD